MILKEFTVKAKGAVNLSHWADPHSNGLFAHPRSMNVISCLAL